MRQPIGIELVKRGVINENDIDKALQYQKTHPDKKLGDILNILGLCDSYILIGAIADILGEKGILLKESDVKLNLEEYVSLDVLKQNKAIPFEIDNGRIKVCFADTANKRAIETIRLLLINKGLIMEKFITFESNIEKVLKSREGNSQRDIKNTSDITGLIDTVIKKAIDKRASDIHFEPMDEELRIRYRIDGELYTAADIEKDKQQQIIGRLKAISNMHQEKQESQDGRISLYNDYNIRVSSQKTVNGEKFCLRLLKKNAGVRNIFDLGFPSDESVLKKCFDKRNSITVIAAPTGEGKTTTLYSVLDYLNKPEINVTTVEDPVEIRVSGINQIEIDAKTNFSDSLRTILRQDPDIILLGEIRDLETAEIAFQAGQTGHYVLSTIHTINAVEVITRLRKMGISDYDVSSTLATSVSQRLIRRICPHCAVKRKFTQAEKNLINKLASKYGDEFDFSEKYTYDTKGCKECNYTGYLDRIAAFEILEITEPIRELISEGASSLKIREQAVKDGYRPLFIDALQKVVDGYVTLEEVNKKLVLF